MSSTPPSDTAIAQRIEELLAQRAPHASICPSEVARSLATGEAAWLALMSEVRRLADELAQAVINKRFVFNSTLRIFHKG